MERIGDYEIGELLGSGGFGAVYAARNPAAPGQRLAIKVLHRELAAQDAVAQRFFQEALALARLEHPAIPRVVAFGPWEGTYYLAQERVEGVLLDAPEGGMAPEQAVERTSQLLQALVYAHQRGIIHRDLKPANVLVAPDGALRVLDFGLAAIVGSGGGQGGVGTVSWSAPEQLRGGAVDGRADLFAAGVMLHFLLTGRPPVATDDLAEYLGWAEGSDRSSLRRLRPDVPGWVERMFASLTAADPAARPASAAEALGSLHEPAEPAARVVDTGPARMTVRAAFDREAYAQDDDPLGSLLLTITAEPGSAPTSFEVSADLFLVLDVSGSMNVPDRYPLLRLALAELLRRVAPRDRVGVILFSTDSAVLSELTLGAEATRSADALVKAMDASRIKFSGTTLAPALKLARERLLRARAPKGHAPVRRVYVLTDGELGDRDDCARELEGFPEAGVEVHVYGFGGQFNAASLKELVMDQRGGSVKPICNERDIVETFAHIAEVNSRLLGQNGRLIVEFDADVDAGDAWMFRPQERLLGPVARRRFERVLGGVEAGRPYAALFELRLPPAEAEARTPVGRVLLRFEQGQSAVELSTSIEAPRQPGGHGAPVDEALQAQTILEPLRAVGDRGAELRATQARLALAIAERRDPGLIDALRAKIDVLEGRRSEASVSHADQQYIDSDASSMAF